jgi:hypothetical protein
VVVVMVVVMVMPRPRIMDILIMENGEGVDNNNSN